VSELKQRATATYTSSNSLMDVAGVNTSSRPMIYSTGHQQHEQLPYFTRQSTRSTLSTSRKL